MTKLENVNESLHDRRDEIDAKRKESIEKQKEKIEDREERNQLKKEIKSEIKQELNSEAYDAEVMGRSQIRRTGEGGRVGADRRLSAPERRRMRAVGGGRQEPVEYSDRSDIGTQRQASTRVQQPEQERGSARERQLAAAKEERRKAAQARIAAKKGGGSPTEEKPKPSEVSQQASKLLSKKKEEKPVSPDYEPPKASGMTRSERMSQQRKGEAALRDIMKQRRFADYEKETGQKPTGKAKTKLLAMVAKQMEN